MKEQDIINEGRNGVICPDCDGKKINGDMCCSICLEKRLDKKQIEEKIAECVSKIEIPKKIQRALLAIEAGQVQRCHTIPHHGSYSVAEHCYGVVSLLFTLYPGDPDTDLIKACLWHDTAERFMGDVPGPAKASMPELYDLFAYHEEQLLKKLGFLFELSTYEYNWVDGLDKLELFIWANHQLHDMGNSLAQEFIDTLRKWFKRKAEELPCEINLFLAHYVHRRLPENFHINGEK